MQVGYDAISRLSIKNVKSIIDEMVLALGRCKRPKLFILMDIIMGRRRDPTSCPPTFCAFEDIDEEAKLTLEKYVSTSQLFSSGIGDHRMFPPGKLAFLRPFPPIGNGRNLQYSWDAVWIRKEGKQLGLQHIYINYRISNTFDRVCRSDGGRNHCVKGHGRSSPFTAGARGPQDCN